MILLSTADKGGATFLKVGGTSCERSEQKIFFEPLTFWHLGVQLETSK